MVVKDPCGRTDVGGKIWFGYIGAEVYIPLMLQFAKFMYPLLWIPDTVMTLDVFIQMNPPQKKRP